MAQATSITISNTTFAEFRQNLNTSLTALNSSHIGSSAPSTAVEGTIWVDNSVSGTLKIKIVDSDNSDIELFQINTSSNSVTLPSSVSVSETDPSAIPFAIALG